MRSQFLAGIFSVCALGVLASEITPEQAGRAARNWRVSRDTLECKLGTTVKSTRAVTTTKAKFNVVTFEEGGYVITSADTSVRPIVFFSDGDDLDEDPRNPMLALIQRDIDVCTQAAEDAAAASGGAALASVRPGAATKSGTELAWAELLEDPDPKQVALASVTPSDIRVGPLCETYWNQSTVSGGKKVYNYYTPSNYVCGCVATAAAQIMRTLRWPRADVYMESFSNVNCHVAGVQTTCHSMGGYYVWDNMPLNPSSSISTTQQQAIGKLCYDLGVAFGMGWASGGSGASVISGRHVYPNIFGYSQAIVAVWSTEANKTASSALTKKAFITNFDAKLPVQIGITDSSGGSGHSIVADGYGYSGTNICYHLNYGWGGSSNGWYVPPDIGSGYVIIDDLCYNIYTNQPSNKVILSGRLLGTDGKAASGLTVEARQGTTVAATTTTDAKGIFALYVSPSQTYTVRSISNGTLAQTTGTTTAIKSVSPVVSNGMVGNSYWVSNIDADVCNATVGDIQLVSTTPVARIGTTDYYVFNEACYAATAGDTITLLQDVAETVTLSVPATVDFNGHTLTGVFYCPVNTGTTILRNGTITGNSDSFDGKAGASDTFPNGTVRFEDMTMTGTVWSDSHPLVFASGTYTGAIRSGDQVCTIVDGSFASLIKDGTASYLLQGGHFAADYSSISTLPSDYYKLLTDPDNTDYPWYVTGAIDYAAPTLADDAVAGTNFTSAVVTCTVNIPYRGTDAAAQLRVVATAANGRAYTNFVALAAGTGSQTVTTTFAALSPAASYGVTADVVFGDGSTTLSEVEMDAEVMHAARKIEAWIDEDATTFTGNSKWTVPSSSTGTVSDGKILVKTDNSLANAVLYTPTARPYDCAAEIMMRMQMWSSLPENLPTLAANTKVAVSSMIVDEEDYFAVWSSGAWTQTDVPCAIEESYDIIYIFDYVEQTVEITATRVGGTDTLSLGRYSFTTATPITEFGFVGYGEITSIDGDSWNANLVRDANGVEYATLEAAVAAGVTSVTLLWDATWSPSAKGHLQVLNPDNKGLSVGTTQLPKGAQIVYDGRTNTYVVTAPGALIILL